MRHRIPRIIVGLTGGMGSGKTTVLRLFRRLGAQTADSDAIVQELLRPGKEGDRRVRRLFGERVLDSRGRLDKTKVANIVFRSQRRRRRLERILHPLVVKRLKSIMRRCRRGVLVLDIPLLYEARLQGLVDVVVVVWALFRDRLERLLASGKWQKAEILRRMKAQMPLRKKARLADAVIDNGKTLRDTGLQVSRLYRALMD